MAHEGIDETGFEYHPVSAERWPDLELLFGPRGACAGCWCMYWRLPRSEFNRQSGEGNQLALKGVIETGRPAGILGYVRDEPAGWCAVAPREEFPGLQRSRLLKPVDDQPVWSITCFFVARRFRHKGVMEQLIRSAVEFARSHNAAIVEGYPIEPKKGTFPDVYAYTGIASAFRQAGFVEVLRRSETRPIMRFSY